MAYPAEREDLCKELETLDGKLAASYQQEQDLSKHLKGLQAFADGQPCTLTSSSFAAREDTAVLADE